VEVADDPAPEALEAKLEAEALALESAELAEPLSEESLEEADAALLEREEALDDPPAPPAPKIVVEPTVVVKVEEPEVSVETIAEVVMAEEEEVVDEEPPAPPAPVPEVAVVVVVPVATVLKVVEVVVATPAPVELPDPPVAAAQYELPKEMTVEAMSVPQAALEQSRIP